MKDFIKMIYIMEKESYMVKGEKNFLMDFLKMEYIMELELNISKKKN